MKTGCSLSELSTIMKPEDVKIWIDGASTVSTANDSFVAYHVKVKTEQFERTAYHRITDFVNLQQCIEKELEAAGRAHLLPPPFKFFSCLDNLRKEDDLIKYRRERLENYLLHLQSRPELFSLFAVQEFLLLFHLKGKVAIVTDVTSTTGRGAAKKLVQMGAHVICTGKDQRQLLGAVDAILLECGNERDVTFMTMNLADTHSIETFVTDIAIAYDKVDLLINAHEEFASEEELRLDGLHPTLSVNLLPTSMLPCPPSSGKTASHGFKSTWLLVQNATLLVTRRKLQTAKGCPQKFVAS